MKIVCAVDDCEFVKNGECVKYQIGIDKVAKCESFVRRVSMRWRKE